MRPQPASGRRQIFAEDGHLEHEGAVAVLVLKDQADELIIHIDLDRIRSLARLQLDAAMIEGALQVAFQPALVVLVHGMPFRVRSARTLENRTREGKPDRA